MVAASLADLKGPTEGTVELPLWLFWSSPDRTFDLSEPGMLPLDVPSRAGGSEPPGGSTAYLDGDTLIALWPDLFLPKGVRQAWEDRHPVLRAAAGHGRLMPVDELHREVAAIALRAAARHGFALGGGNALIAHGIIDRPTDDVDLFSDQEAGVVAAADAVEAALRDAGFQAERQDKTGGLADIFEGMGEGLAEWIITAPGGQQIDAPDGLLRPEPRAGDHGRRARPGSGGRDRREGVRAGQPG